MGEMSSIWGYEEVQNQDMDQLVQKLLYTTLELEKLKSEKMIEVQKNKEDVDKLILLLKCAIQERDEARNELGKLVRIIHDIFSIFPEFKPVMAKPEPNSLSDTNSYNSPPAESLIDVVPPPEFSNMVASQPLVDFSAKIDQESLIVDNYLKGRVLPRNGMFVQAVLEAGPLLQTLLVACPLPKWRNPPQLRGFQIPPVSIKGGDAEVLGAPIVGQMSAHSYANLGCEEWFFGITWC